MSARTDELETILRLARRVSLLAGAFVICATAMGLLNKWFIADPIVRAVSEERLARQTADSLIVQRMGEIDIAAGQLERAIEASTYSRAQIDRMRWEADQIHENFGARLKSIEAHKR